jgi:hypothetical protein
MSPTEGHVNIADTRRTNLRTLIEQHGGVSRLSEKLGYRSPSFLVQQAGPNPSREVTEKSARNFEQKLGLEAGYLDRNPDLALTQQAPVVIDSGVISDVIRLVGALMAREQVPVPAPERFADLLALAVTDTLEHGGVPRESHIRSVVRLLKG